MGSRDGRESVAEGALAGRVTAMEEEGIYRGVVMFL